MNGRKKTKAQWARMHNFPIPSSFHYSFTPSRRQSQSGRTGEKRAERGRSVRRSVRFLHCESVPNRSGPACAVSLFSLLWSQARATPATKRFGTQPCLSTPVGESEARQICPQGIKASERGRVGAGPDKIKKGPSPPPLFPLRCDAYRWHWPVVDLQ